MTSSEILNYGMTEMPIISKKEDILKTWTASITAITEEVSPIINSIISTEEEIKVLNKSEFLNNLRTLSSTKISKNLDYIKALQVTFDTFVKIEEDVNNAINKLPNAISNDVFSIRDVATIKLVQDVSSMVLYFMGSLVLMLEYKTNNTTLPKKAVEEIISGAITFGNLFKFYYSKDFELFLKDLPKLPDDKITLQKSDTGMLTSFVNNLLNKFTTPIFSGFNGNPLYHIRMWRVDRQMRKLEALKSQRELAEYKLLKLRNDKLNTNDKSLDRQIEYYENKIIGINAEIKDIVES